MSVSSVQPAQAISSTSVHGAWQLLSYDVEEQANGNTFAPMGDNPSGYVIFTAEGRLSFMLSGEGRQPGSNAEERSALLSSMIAYTGTYRLEDDRWITQVDVAWNPEWVGTEQTRFFAIEGDVLTVHTPWRVMPNWPEKGLTRSIVRFQRCR
ncbi:lipocalin-like domain-containing protein [Synechococcus sp. N32]|uniref:lipocalin-like domain-containing protein n=1 Tax=Synechococcus sp. N32 TaxID=2575514 RepID=UPI000E0E80CB|nr:lipocalin-like domain-containing protein [Synechococcus sp. N32]